MSVSTKFWDILHNQNDKSSVLRMAIISFLKPAEFIENVAVIARLDGQGQLDVLSEAFLGLFSCLFFFLSCQEDISVTIK